MSTVFCSMETVFVDKEKLLAKGEFVLYSLDMFISYCARWDLLAEDERGYNWFYVWQQITREVK